nr:hypothetical protein [Tanacetum cinerariifolium]
MEILLEPTSNKLKDALDSAAGGKFLDKIPRKCLSIIESKSNIAASLEDKLDIRMNRFEKSLNVMKNSFITPTALLKAVEEDCDGTPKRPTMYLHLWSYKAVRHRSKSENMGIVPNEMELILEQTQQGHLKMEVKVTVSNCLKDS